MIQINPQPEQMFPVHCCECGCVYNYSLCEHSHGYCQKCKDRILTELRAKCATQPKLHYGDEGGKKTVLRY